MDSRAKEVEGSRGGKGAREREVGLEVGLDCVKGVAMAVAVAVGVEVEVRGVAVRGVGVRGEMEAAKQRGRNPQTKTPHPQ